VPKLKPQEVEERRREIIEAARRCFLQNGFHQTTTDEICREASITPGGLYHYFGSKDELIAAVIEDALDRQNLRSTAETSGDEHRPSTLASQFFEWIRDPSLTTTRLDMEIWGRRCGTKSWRRYAQQPALRRQCWSR
jgi:AcrR family transcriptional regulator